MSAFFLLNELPPRRRGILEVLGKVASAMDRNDQQVCFYQRSANGPELSGDPMADRKNLRAIVL